MTIIALFGNLALGHVLQTCQLRRMSRVARHAMRGLRIDGLPLGQVEMIVTIDSSAGTKVLLQNIRVAFQTRVVAKRIARNRWIFVIAREIVRQVVCALLQPLRSAEHSAAAVTIDASGFLLSVKCGECPRIFLCRLIIVLHLRFGMTGRAK